MFLRSRRCHQCSGFRVTTEELTVGFFVKVVQREATCMTQSVHTILRNVQATKNNSTHH